MGRKLTVVSAPAGFGKTTLICDWINDLNPGAENKNSTTYRAYWLSLDESDNNPARFLVYLIAALKQAANEGGRISRTIEILALQALAFQAKSDLDRGMEALAQSLTLAKPEGFLRAFVDEGSLMARLLYEALKRQISPGYVRQLLAAFPNDEPEQAAPAPAKISEAEWVEPLSDREIEVIQLIAEGLTNQEIASKPYLSLNTVKVHTRNIYSKLAVNHRAQAVARARSLGILSSN